MNQITTRHALRFNAAICSLCGAILVLAPGAVAAFMGGFPSWICLALGVGLLLFAADVFWVSTRATLSTRLVRFISSADIGWVVATPVVMLVFMDSLNLWGHLLLADLALITMAVAYFQLRGIRNLEAAAC